RNQSAALYIPVQGKTRKLQGSGILTTAPGTDRSKDRFDFSIIELPPQLVSSLGDIRYVTERELSLPEASSDGHFLMALGVPNSKNKKVDHAKRQVSPRRAIYAASAMRDDRLAEQLGISGTDHLFVKY